MEFLIISIIVVFILILLENRMSANWSRAVFKYSPAIYQKKVIGFYIENIDLNLLEESYVKKLLPPLKFKKDNNEIYFTENFKSSGFIPYTPILNGQIISNERGIKIIGRLRWSTILFLICWYSFVFIFPWNDFDNTSTEHMFKIFLYFPLVVIGSLYALQAFRFSNIGNRLNDQS